MKSNFLFSIVCDDVRREDNGKLIAIGIYAGHVLVPQFPANLVLSTLACINGDDGASISVGIRSRLGETVTREVLGEILLERKGRAMINATGFPFLNIEENAEIHFDLKLDDGEWQPAVSLIVILGPTS